MQKNRVSANPRDVEDAVPYGIPSVCALPVHPARSEKRRNLKTSQTFSTLLYEIFVMMIECFFSIKIYFFTKYGRI